MKNVIYKKTVHILLISLGLVSCEDYVEIDTPIHKMTSQDVFSSEATAISAMNGIYNQLALASFSEGSTSSITFLAGLSADNLQNIRSTNMSRMEFEQNEILPTNSPNYYMWSSAYNIIYLTNSLLEGLENSPNVSEEVKMQLEGEAAFVRAFTYFYLVNLYGDVPLILQTDYRQNMSASRDPQEVIYQRIVTDLQTAVNSLGSEFKDGERTRATNYAAMALLSRVYLYLEEWQLAEDYSSQVIGQNQDYEILQDLDEVFLANSREAIWQISPAGRGNVSTQTNEGNLFIIHPIFSFFATVQLDNDIVAVFENEDKRLSNWVGYHTSMDAYYAYKYKIWNSSEKPIQEYSMVLRLAEQYLIRAEARANQDKLAEAIQDVDVLRQRAGLSLIAETNPGLSREDLLEIMLEERRKELFAEWGHRWLDLKRMNIAGEILGANNPLWESTDELYPIPGEERMLNPQLTQNPGY